MRTNKMCISKKFISLLFLIFIFISSYYFIFRPVLNRKIIKSNQAAPLKIIGGTDVLPGEFPAVVLIKNITPINEQYDNVKSCTGTLISPNLVLTAAHCLNNQGDTYVTVGIINENDFSYAIKSIGMISHPDFESKGADIGLIILDTKISGITFPKLPEYPFDLKRSTDKNMYKKNNNVTAVGWGCVGYEPTPTPSYSLDSLYKACSVFKSKDECNTSGRSIGCGYDLACIGCGYNSHCDVCMPWNSSYNIDYSDCSKISDKINQVNNNNSISSIIPIPPSPVPIYIDNLQKISLPIFTSFSPANYLSPTFEVGYNDNRALYQTVCSGDSGGPLFYKKNGRLYVLGVNSYIFVNHGNILPLPSISTNVMAYSDWISSQISIYSPTSTIHPSPLPTTILSKEELDDQWRLCASFHNVNDCMTYGVDRGCMYFQGLRCQACVPRYYFAKNISRSDEEKSCDYIKNLLKNK